MERSGKIIRTVDVVLSDEKRVLLIRRAKPPFLDKLVLPGGHKEKADRTMIAAAQREMREEVGLEIDAGRFQFLCTLDTPGRDPRPGRRVSTVFYVELKPEELDRAKAGDDAAEVILHETENSLDSETLGFDHFDAIATYYNYRNLLDSFEEDDGWPGTIF